MSNLEYKIFHKVTVDYQFKILLNIVFALRM